MDKRSFGLGVLFLSLLFALGTHCAKNPVTGKKEFVLISEAQEIAMGRESHPAILAQFGEVPDQELQAYFNDIGQRMARLSHRPNLEWKFTVVDDPLVNAFAVPGGYIYFTRGILSYMNNEAELAGVLGHEIGHVTARHSVSQLSKTQLFGLGVGLGSVFSPTFAGLSDYAQMGLGILFLKYSRDDESESDELGIRYMYDLGYDPRALSGFFEVFKRMSEEQGSGVPGWLSSHPSPPDRIQKTSALAQSMLNDPTSQSDLKIGRQNFLKQINGIVYGENPREGFVRNGTFYHPDLRFQLRFPGTWRVQNTRSAVFFLEPSQNVGVQLTLAPSEVRSPRVRAEQVAQQQGVEMVETNSRSINGLSAYSALYHVRSQRGTIHALASFVSYRDRLYELIGMGAPNDFSQYFDSLNQIIRSFQRLNDRNVLSVQPDRLELYTIKRGGSLNDVARLYPNSRVDVKRLSLLNRVGENERLKAGQVIKVVKAGY